MRIIYRLDVKTKNVVKPISFEGLRKVGNPVECAEKAYKEGADEILFLDIVASLYDRKFNYEIIKDTVKDVFLPITVGGGIKNIDDATNLIYAGADKLAINTSLFDTNHSYLEVYQTCQALKRSSQNVTIFLQLQTT